MIVCFIAPFIRGMSSGRSKRHSMHAKLKASYSTGSGLYCYNLCSGEYKGIADHPQLKSRAGKSSTSYVLEDSKHRLWISLARMGVLRLDKATGKTKLYAANDSSRSSITGNQIVDIKEDGDGKIWFSAISGISMVDPDTDSVVNYTADNGLPGTWSSPLCVDRRNRVWVGVNGGMVMIDSSRTQIIRFGLADGLPSLGFNEHAGITTSKGLIIMPSTNGYVLFDPLHFSPDNGPLRYYLHSYAVNDVSYRPHIIDQGLSIITLKADENAFTLHLVALNYLNPNHTWFAYKLEGIEKNWHYTQDPRAVYTNVDGGSYRFLFKASTTNTNWDRIPAKTAEIYLDTVFYKKIWFKILIVFVLLALLYVFYRYRTTQQRQLYLLRNQTELLEKEKAVVMYESLKQHLNPHFLFNSLTSLRSLIRTDSRRAANFLDGLSRIYRYVLKSSNNELVLLQDELDFAQTFSELQRVRFGDGLQVRMQVDESDTRKYVVPVVLQNLIENAIKHNTTSMESPLEIDIYTEDDYLLVRNNLQRYRVVETSNKQGLQSLRKLYSFYTDRPIEVKETDTHFTISIPLL